MVTRVTFPQVPGEWVRATEYEALAAHVEALVAWADAYVGTTGLYEEVESARNANTTPLAHLKAQWQAEVLESLWGEMHKTEDNELIATRIQELHRQAKGGE